MGLFLLGSCFGLTDSIEAAQASLADAQRLSGDLTIFSRYRAISQMTDSTAQTFGEKS
jgi:hypothetical protein